MIYITTDEHYNTYIDDDANEFIKNFLQDDCPEYAAEINATIDNWKGRILLFKGMDYENMEHGCRIRYVFQVTSSGYDMEIEEIALAEDMDDFLDLYNEIPKVDTNLLSKTV